MVPSLDSVQLVHLPLELGQCFTERIEVYFLLANEPSRERPPHTALSPSSDFEVLRFRLLEPGAVIMQGFLIRGQPLCRDELVLVQSVQQRDFELTVDRICQDLFVV